MIHRMRLAIPATVVALALVAASTMAAGQRPDRDLRPMPIEINLVGYQTEGDRLDYGYVLPGDTTLRYFATRGMTTVRLPMAWARLQPVTGGALDEAKARELEAFLDRADRLRVSVIADLHNFGGRDGHQLGSRELATSALADFWARFARRFPRRFAGFDLMNEPHDMPSPQAWPRAAQEAVDAIRRVDRRTTIYVEGDDWSNAGRWQQSNAGLDIRDPARRLVYSAHVYFDRDTSGTYRQPFDQDGATAATGAERLAPFVAWLRARKARGHIGEFGIPYRDPQWLAVLDGFLDAVARDRDVLGGVAYWGAGEWMDFYDLTLQPAADGRWADRPQLSTLMRARQGAAPRNSSLP